MNRKVAQHPISPASNPAVYLELTPEEVRIYEFLLRLRQSDLEVAHHEGPFILDLLANPRPLNRVQREKVDQLRTQYEGRL